MDNVVFIIEENKNWTQVTSTFASSIPYFNQLRTTGEWATGKFTNHADAQNYNTTSLTPSAPNYLALTSGRLLQNGSDGWNPYAFQNIVDLLETGGVSWGAYMEGLPSNWLSHPGQVGLYATKHNPFVYYTDITGNSSRTPKVKDYSAFVPGAERFQWITPNLTDDGHTDPGGHTSPVPYELAFTDAFLQSLIPTIMNSAAFAPGKKAVIVITWDGGDVPNEHSPCLFLGPGAHTVVSSVAYTHFSMLATWENMFGLGNLGQNDATAPVMTDMISGGGTSDFPLVTSQSTSSERLVPHATVQAGTFNSSLVFAGVGSESFSPTAPQSAPPGAPPLISPPISCGVQSLPTTTSL